VAHLQGTLAALAHDGKGLGQDLVHRLALGDAVLERLGLGPQRLVVQGLHLGLQCIDLLDDAAVLLQQALVAATEDLGEKRGQHAVILGR